MPRGSLGARVRINSKRCVARSRSTVWDMLIVAISERTPGRGGGESSKPVLCCIGSSLRCRGPPEAADLVTKTLRAGARASSPRATKRRRRGGMAVTRSAPLARSPQWCCGRGRPAGLATPRRIGDGAAGPGEDSDARTQDAVPLCVRSTSCAKSAIRSAGVRLSSEGHESEPMPLSSNSPSSHASVSSAQDASPSLDVAARPERPRLRAAGDNVLSTSANFSTAAPTAPPKAASRVDVNKHTPAAPESSTCPRLSGAPLVQPPGIAASAACAGAAERRCHVPPSLHSPRLTSQRSRSASLSSAAAFSFTPPAHVLRLRVPPATERPFANTEACIEASTA
mmetsp:Transcript_37271/g.102475  ORF Transcript_37271/g.102475 Transcript_37271/m.102475 type:complete len:340 (+) Transcript_37271:104-1123(+)